MCVDIFDLGAQVGLLLTEFFYAFHTEGSPIPDYGIIKVSVTRIVAFTNAEVYVLCELINGTLLELHSCPEIAHLASAWSLDHNTIGHHFSARFCSAIHGCILKIALQCSKSVRNCSIGPVYVGLGLSIGYNEYRLLSSFLAVYTEPSSRQLVVSKNIASWTEATFVPDRFL